MRTWYKSCKGPSPDQEKEGTREVAHGPRQSFLNPFWCCLLLVLTSPGEKEVGEKGITCLAPCKGALVRTELQSRLWV